MFLWGLCWDANKMPHHVYIIECSNNSFYTGYTTDIKRRYKEHQAGSLKCKYTRSFPPKKLVAVFDFKTKSEALIYENKIKSLSRAQKIEMLARHEGKPGKVQMF